MLACKFLAIRVIRGAYLPVMVTLMVVAFTLDSLSIILYFTM